MTDASREEIVETMARAICEADGFDPDGPTVDIYVIGDPVAGIPWAGYRRHARAALTALEAKGYTVSRRAGISHARERFEGESK